MGGEKLSKKKLAMAAMAVIALGLGLALQMPRTYSEAEIDEELCRRLAPQDSGLVTGADTPLDIVEIRRVDDSIIAAYAWGDLRPAMGYLRFVDNGGGRYRLAANKSESLMWRNNYSGGSEVFYTHNEAGELQSYYILLTGHESASRVEVYGQTDAYEEERLLAEFAVEGRPAICIWRRPLAGHYTVLREDGSRLWERRFTCVETREAELGLDFMVDWQDCREGSSGALAARAALVSEPGRKLGRAYIGVAAPPALSIRDARPLAVSRGRFGYGHELVDSACLQEGLAATVALPEAAELDSGSDDGLAYEAGLHSLHRAGGYVRGVVLRFGRERRLRQAGDYVEAVFDFGDYLNAPRPPAEWQVLWQVDNAWRLETRPETAIY